VPYPLGGGIDPSARVIVESLSKTLGQIRVDNLAGATGRIGTRIAAHAAPDGYTLLCGSGAPNVILPAAYGDKIGYRQEKDFIPIALVAQTDYVLLVSSSLPVQDIKQLIDYAWRYPRQVTYASSGLLSGPHLAGELLGKLAGVELTHVPYRGNGAALIAVIGGEVSMAFDSAGGVVANGKSDAYKVLAVNRRTTPWRPSRPCRILAPSIPAMTYRSGTDSLLSAARRPTSSLASRRPCITP
jgi:tripartite-type tricarboxylate transporter receptor subunit TctC